MYGVKNGWSIVGECKVKYGLKLMLKFKILIY